MLLVLIALALLVGLHSLRGDRARLEYTRRRRAEPPRETPPATVIVPVKGADEGLAENLEALAGLDYPDYELLIVAREASDVPPGVLPAGSRLVLAGDEGPGGGEKVNNLLAAVAAARSETRVFAFADSDGRAGRGWLKALVRGLEEPGAGAASGYRQYLPEPPDFWSQMRGVWNAVIAGEFGGRGAPFAWGGAMAIRREVFDRAKVAEAWCGALSDDSALSAAVRKAGYRIIYAPGALVVSSDHTAARELLRWIRRQLLIVRVHAPRLWMRALIGHIIYCGAMAASLAVAVQRPLLGTALLAAQFVLAWRKGANRLRVIRAALPGRSGWLARHGGVQVWWVPLGTWLWMIGLALSAAGNTIEWRGVRYRLSKRGVKQVG